MLEWMLWTLQTGITVGAVIVLLIISAVYDSINRSYGRKGFLPIKTTRGDRIFISLILMIFIGILWLKFLYIPFKIPMWGAFGVAIVLMAIISKWG